MNFNDHQQTLEIMKLSDLAYIPVRGSPNSAGLDLRSAYDSVVPKHGKCLIKTDLAIKLPLNCYGRIAPRSGLAFNHFIDVGAGVVDVDYRGNIQVLLFNHSNEDYSVKRGDKIAQLICEVITYPVVKEVFELDVTVRGTQGFGSSGI